MYSKGQQAESVDCDIYQYGHFEVDRIGVLLDVWANEALFLECKLNVRFIWILPEFPALSGDLISDIAASTVYRIKSC